MRSATSHRRFALRAAPARPERTGGLDDCPPRLLFIEGGLLCLTLNRLTNLANSWAGSFGFSYDSLSRRTQLTRPNGVATSYSYNSLSRLLSVVHQLSGSTIDGASYTLDAAGNRTVKVNDLSGGATSNYGYDAIYELLSATQGANTTESYTYDPVGNRLSSLGVSSYSYNVSNELTSSSAASYGYDNNGNTTSKTVSGNTTNYSWDYENRLTSVTLPNSGGTVTFEYDPFGRRIYKQSPSATSIFVYDGDNLVQTVNSTGGLVARYAQTMNIDEPLAMQRGTTTDYYQADGLGSITSLSSSSGALANTYTYDSFGNVTNSTGSVTNFLEYTGREFDTETNLYFYRARYYDQLTGRFLSEDPIRFQIQASLYRYTGNNPLIYSDPLGLRDYSQQETQQILELAYEDATSGFTTGLWRIHNHSQGGGDYDFANNSPQDTFRVCGRTLSAGDFGNYIAGFQAGTWDQTNYGDPWRPFVRWAEGFAYMAGIYYHATGQSAVPNDPWDKTGRPWIKLGADDGRNYAKTHSMCNCESK